LKGRKALGKRQHATNEKAKRLLGWSPALERRVHRRYRRSHVRLGLLKDSPNKPPK
jgi:hypothetical protein